MYIKALLVFITTYYLGLVGYSDPCEPISVISCISFLLFVVNFFMNLSSIKNYILPIILITVLYYWSYDIEHLPLYGRYVVYNPFSVFGIGSKFYGKRIEPLKTCSGEIKDYIGVQKIEPHNTFSKVFSEIIRSISSIIYIFGINWIGNTKMIDSFTNIRAVANRTGIKSVLGYVPKNMKLEKTLFNKIMQYRVYSDSTISKIASVIRRYGLIGMDMDSLDRIFESVDYNNVGTLMDVEKLCKERTEYFKNKENASFIEMWRWEVLPYIYHWTKLSTIVYVLYILRKVLVNIISHKLL